MAGVLRFVLAAALAGGFGEACGSGPPDVHAEPERTQPDPKPDPKPHTPAIWSDTWLLGEVDRYLDDRAFRRDILERSLTSHDNQYSRARLSAYALERGGWDELPPWMPRTHPVTVSDTDALLGGRAPALDETTAPIWDGTRPRTMQAWARLGKTIFFQYPLRRFGAQCQFLRVEPARHVHESTSRKKIHLRLDYVATEFF
jgi:hypothetical protein